MSYYTDNELRSMGLKGHGQNVRVSRKASIYGAERIYIADHVRIDDFAVLSAGEGGINIGRHVHIAVFASLIGAGNITVSHFAGLSGRVSVYSSTDNFHGDALTGPTLAPEYTKVRSADVYIGRHVVVGSGSVVLPGTRLNDGCAVGAMSLVNKDLKGFTLYAGIPARPIGNRSRKLLEIEGLVNSREGWKG